MIILTLVTQYSSNIVFKVTICYFFVIDVSVFFISIDLYYVTLYLIHLPLIKLFMPPTFYHLYEDQTGHYKSTWVQKRFTLSYTAKNDAEWDMTSFVFYQTYLLFILALFLRNINNMLLHLQIKVEMCQVSRLKRKMMRYHFNL